jgi:hypothetical protein
MLLFHLILQNGRLAHVLVQNKIEGWFSLDFSILLASLICLTLPLLCALRLEGSLSSRDLRVGLTNATDWSDCWC